PHGAGSLYDASTWSGTLDRPPCANGTSARVAAKHARGERAVGERFVHESMMGTTFTAEVREETTLGGVPAVVPSISGRGWITGFKQLVVEADDPFPVGYTVGDIWGRGIGRMTAEGVDGGPCRDPGARQTLRPGEDQPWNCSPTPSSSPERPAASDRPSPRPAPGRVRGWPPSTASKRWHRPVRASPPRRSRPSSRICPNPPGAPISSPR